jgi:hypothetical protein
MVVMAAPTTGHWIVLMGLEVAILYTVAAYSRKRFSVEVPSNEEEIFSLRVDFWTREYFWQ